MSNLACRIPVKNQSSVDEQQLMQSRTLFKSNLKASVELVNANRILEVRTFCSMSSPPAQSSVHCRLVKKEILLHCTFLYINTYTSLVCSVCKRGEQINPYLSEIQVEMLKTHWGFDLQASKDCLEKVLEE